MGNASRQGLAQVAEDPLEGHDVSLLQQGRVSGAFANIRQADTRAVGPAPVVSSAAFPGSGQCCSLRPSAGSNPPSPPFGKGGTGGVSGRGPGLPDRQHRPEWPFVPRASFARSRRRLLVGAVCQAGERCHCPGGMASRLVDPLPTHGLLRPLAYTMASTIGDDYSSRSGVGPRRRSRSRSTPSFRSQAWTLATSTDRGGTASAATMAAATPAASPVAMHEPWFRV